MSHKPFSSSAAGALPYWFFVENQVTSLDRSTGRSAAIAAEIWLITGAAAGVIVSWAGPAAGRASV
jgi:hypothetical protein